MPRLADLSDEMRSWIERLLDAFGEDWVRENWNFLDSRDEYLRSIGGVPGSITTGTGTDEWASWTWCQELVDFPTGPRLEAGPETLEMFVPNLWLDFAEDQDVPERLIHLCRRREHGTGRAVLPRQVMPLCGALLAGNIGVGWPQPSGPACRQCELVYGALVAPAIET